MPGTCRRSVGNVGTVTSTQSDQVTGEPTGTAGLEEWIGPAVLALPTLLISMDLSLLYLAIPHISEALQPSSSQLLWILDIYGFLVAGFLITMGTLGDRIGRRKLLMIGAVDPARAGAASAISETGQELSAALGVAVIGSIGTAVAAALVMVLLRHIPAPNEKPPTTDADTH